MFKKLRNKIIIITMAATTTVLLVADISIIVFSSNLRPEPIAPLSPPNTDERIEKIEIVTNNYNQEITRYIKEDRADGELRLIITLFYISILIEIIVFITTYYLSQKIIDPVKSSYDKQKLFIANASHELKTPLAVIQANIEALEVDKENKKWKNNIETEIAHANKLVLDLLQLARMDASKSATKAVEEFNLATEVKNRIDIFQPKFNGKIIHKTHKIKGNHSLPKQDLMQVLDILLDNATKYGNKKIVVTVNQAGISVQNDGATIPKKDREKIFDRFYQTDKTREGSGLGLAIAKAICDQNNWQLSCNSVNKQTTFNLKF